MGASWTFAALALVALGCRGPSPIERVVAEPPIETPATEPARGAAVSSADAGCWAGEPSASPTPVGARSLDVEIELAQMRILEAQYQDAGALVRLSRLQLMRDQREPDPDGATDAERSRKNAMRAVVITDLPEPRMLLAMVVAYSLESPTPDARARLVGALIGQSSGAAGFSEAGRKVLEGYALLERGDPTAARALFEAATRADPEVASGYVGLGDAARARGAGDEAIAAYERARTILPNDAGIARSLDAARGGAPLAVPEETTFGRSLRIALDPLVPSGLGAATCPALGAAEAEGSERMCAGLAKLRLAASPGELERAANDILDGWRRIEHACAAREIECGPHVAFALREAARGFRAAGQVAKGIATAKLLLKSTPALTGSGALEAELTAEIGDMFAVIGVLDQAASFYEKAGSAAALERALMLRLVSGEVESAVDLVTKASANRSLSVSERTRWVALVAAALVAQQRAGSAQKWAERHAALLREPGASPDVADLLRARPPGDRRGFLRCAARRLAGEPGWARVEVALRDRQMR